MQSHKNSMNRKPYKNSTRCDQKNTEIYEKIYLAILFNAIIIISVNINVLIGRIISKRSKMALKTPIKTWCNN